MPPLTSPTGRPLSEMCRRGLHPMDGLHPSGARYCKTCKRDSARRREGVKRTFDLPAGLRTHCPQGHPYDEANTYHASHGRVCKACQKDRNRAAEAARTPAERRDRDLRKTYGITLAQYEEMVIEQGGVCAVCKNDCFKPVLSVDHDAKTGRVRGLLCHKCNAALGLLDEDSDRMLALIDYLREG